MNNPRPTGIHKNLAFQPLCLSYTWKGLYQKRRIKKRRKQRKKKKDDLAKHSLINCISKFGKKLKDRKEILKWACKAVRRPFSCKGRRNSRVWKLTSVFCLIFLRKKLSSLVESRTPLGSDSWSDCVFFIWPMVENEESSLTYEAGAVLIQR